MSAAACKVAINSESQAALNSLSSAMETFESLLLMMGEGPDHEREEFANEAIKLDEEIQSCIEKWIKLYRDINLRVANSVEL